MKQKKQISGMPIPFKDTYFSAPPWEFRGNRNISQELKWHQDEIIFKSVFAPNCPVVLTDIGWDYLHSENALKKLTGMEHSSRQGLIDNMEKYKYTPLAILKRRHSKSPAKRPIAIVDGAHGRWDGDNWEASRHRGIESSLLKHNKSNLNFLNAQNKSTTECGHTSFLNDEKKTPYFYLRGSKENSFESRLRIYNVGDLKIATFMEMLLDAGSHVIYFTCYGRNDIALRTLFKPVISYISPLHESNEFYDKNESITRAFIAKKGTLLELASGSKKEIAGSFVTYNQTNGTATVILMKPDALCSEKRSEYLRTKQYMQVKDAKLWMSPD